MRCRMVVARGGEVNEPQSLHDPASLAFGIRIAQRPIRALPLGSIYDNSTETKGLY